MQIFEYIKPGKFFKTYCPQIRNIKQKLAGKPAQFTKQDQAQIRAGLQQLFIDLNQSS